MANKQRLKTGDYVLVEWEDSYSFPHWRKDSELSEAMDGGLRCSTVGHFFEDKDGRIGVVQNQSYDPDGGITRGGELMVIPKSAIKKIRRLK